MSLISSLTYNLLSVRIQADIILLLQDAPAEALPPHLESDYGPEANQPAPEDLKPSSGLLHSSTAEEPPHPVLSDHAKSGKLAERNSQPTAEMGRQGNSEAWKSRK